MKKVSEKTHSKANLDHYANQKNPNSKAYRVNQENIAKMKAKKSSKYDIGILTGESFGWCDD